MTTIELHIDNIPEPTPYQQNLPKYILDRNSIHQDISSTEGVRLFNTEDCGNHYINSALLAYNNHVGWHIRPDDFMAMVNMIICRYVNLRPEIYESKFVTEKKSIILTDIVEGGEDWDDMLNKWSNLITQHSDNPLLINTMRSNFSTSRHEDLATSNAIIMSTTQEYFEYHCSTKCGIPHVKMEGTLDDWHMLIEKVAFIALEFTGTSLYSYLNNKIIPILIELHATILGNLNRIFWSNIIQSTDKTGFISGCDKSYNGWMLDFVPKMTLDGDVVFSQTSKFDRMPTSIIRTSFVYRTSVDHYMTIEAGSFGVEQDNNGCVSPIYGYRILKQS